MTEAERKAYAKGWETAKRMAADLLTQTALMINMQLPRAENWGQERQIIAVRDTLNDAAEAVRNLRPEDQSHD